MPRENETLNLRQNDSVLQRTEADARIDWHRELYPAPPTQKMQDNASADCKPSPKYERIIDTVARHMFEPHKLGDAQEIKSRFNCQIKSDADVHKYAREAVLSLDSNSVVHTPEEIQKLAERRTGNFGGIGASINRRKDAEGVPEAKGPFIVGKIIHGGPADLKGIKPGDQITQVNGTDVSNKSLPEMVELLRGEVGTDVSITIVGKDEPVAVTRDRIAWPAVEDKMLPGTNFAYVRLDNFEQMNGPASLKNALNKYPDADAVIFDLRNNMGGLDLVSYQVLSLFLESGVIHKTTSRIESPVDNPLYEQRETKLTSDSIITTSTVMPEQHLYRFEAIKKPFAVLVNGASASASELVVGAVQDHKVATIIGTKTFGKSDGQKFIPNVPEGGLTRITASRGYSPADRWFGNGSTIRHGIEPDIHVEFDPRTEFASPEDAQLNAAIRHLTQRVSEERS